MHEGGWARDYVVIIFIDHSDCDITGSGCHGRWSLPHHWRLCWNGEGVLHSQPSAEVQSRIFRQQYPITTRPRWPKVCLFYPSLLCLSYCDSCFGAFVTATPTFTSIFNCFCTCNYYTKYNIIDAYYVFTDSYSLVWHRAVWLRLQLIFGWNREKAYYYAGHNLCMQFLCVIVSIFFLIRPVPFHFLAWAVFLNFMFLHLHWH